MADPVERTPKAGETWPHKWSSGDSHRVVAVDPNAGRVVFSRFGDLELSFMSLANFLACHRPPRPALPVPRQVFFAVDRQGRWVPTFGASSREALDAWCAKFSVDVVGVVVQTTSCEWVEEQDAQHRAHERNCQDSSAQDGAQ